MFPLDRSTFDRAQTNRPQWRQSSRIPAYEVFDKLEMPDAKEEAWRYVELDFDLADYAIPDGPGPSIDRPEVIREALQNTAGLASIKNGVVTVEKTADDVVFTSLAAAGPEHGTLVLDYIAQDLDIFSAAHHAFGGDGLLLSVDRPISEPFFVDIQATTPGSVTFPRISVTVADNASASVVLNCRSPHDADLVVVPQIEADVGDGARLEITILQNWGYATKAIGQSRVVVGRDATIRIAEVGLGADLSRLHMTVDLEGRGSSSEILGVYFGERDQTLDYRYFMNHIGPNTTSEMFLKGAVEDEALSVFTGMIRIEKEAQRTSAHQTNRNLILSDGAAAQSVPNLEILANDVRCGHGSTMGPLDAEQRYYLMSRGLDRERSDRLQVRGFFEEVIARLPRSEIADPVRDWLNTKFITAQAEGRVQ